MSGEFKLIDNNLLVFTRGINSFLIVSVGERINSALTIKGSSGVITKGNESADAAYKSKAVSTKVVSLSLYNPLIKRRILSSSKGKGFIVRGFIRKVSPGKPSSLSELRSKLTLLPITANDLQSEVIC